MVIFSVSQLVYVLSTAGFSEPEQQQVIQAGWLGWNCQQNTQPENAQSLTQWGILGLQISPFLELIFQMQHVIVLFVCPVAEDRERTR